MPKQEMQRLHQQQTWYIMVNELKKAFCDSDSCSRNLQESKTNESVWNNLSKFTFVRQVEETMALLKYTEIFVYENQ